MTLGLILTDTIILSAIGTILLLMVSIIGWFIQKWVKDTSARGQQCDEILKETSASLFDLNKTISQLNMNMETHQASINETIKGLKENVVTHTKKLDEHRVDLQDHEIRITILEKKK